MSRRSPFDASFLEAAAQAKCGAVRWMNGGYMGNAQPPVILGKIWQSMLLRAGGGFQGMRKGLEGREMCRKKPSQALMHGRHVIRQLVAQHHALNPRVYGSVLRQEDKEDSDLDILVDPTPETTLFDLGGLQEALEEALGVRIDLKTPRDLPERIRVRVLREAVPV